MCKPHSCGVQAAMEAMTSELMLMGVATLILLVFQRDISRICGVSRLHSGLPQQFFCKTSLASNVKDPCATVDQTL